MVIEIEKRTEAVPEDEDAQGKVPPETLKNLAASATGGQPEASQTDEADLAASEVVLVTPPEKEELKKRDRSSQQQLGTAAAARQVTTAQAKKDEPQEAAKPTNTPAPEAASPSPAADAGGEGGKKPPEKPQKGAEDDGERPQPKAKKVHDTLSTALEKNGEPHGFYNRMNATVVGESVTIESEHTYLAGPHQASTIEEAENAHREVLKAGKAITTAEFTCTKDETDKDERPVKSYTFTTAKPEYFDTDLHEKELATFLGTTEEEVFQKNGEFFDENRRVMTPTELSRAIDKPDADLSTPVTLVRTTYRDPGEAERLEVVSEDDPAHAPYRLRLSALERQLSRRFAPAEEARVQKGREELGKELYLTPEEQANIDEDVRLIDGYRQGDQILAAHFADRHRGVVWEIVRNAFAKNPTTRLDFEDGLQEAYLALFRATKTWDPSIGVPFIHYAGNDVRWAVGHSLEDQSHSVRLSATANKLVHQIRITNFIRQQEGKPPLTDEEVSELTSSPLYKDRHKITVAELRRAEALTTSLGSFDIEDQIYHEGTDIYTSPEQVSSRQHHPRVTPITGQNTPEDKTQEVIDRIVLAEAIDKYLQMDAMGMTRDKREEELKWWAMHAGVSDEPMSFNQIAKMAGISRNSVEKRLRKYRDRLRGRFTDEPEV